MSPADTSDRFCRYEGDNFPDGEFSDDPIWGKVHEVQPRHTVHGAIIDRKSPGPSVETVDDPEE